MMRVLLKTQWKSALSLVLFFCFLLVGYNGIALKFDERYSKYQTAYMESLNTNDRTEFFIQLEKDSTQAKQIVSAIEKFDSYDGDRASSEVIDPLMAAAGGQEYVNYEMIAWREEMLQMPGTYAETLSDDDYMLMQLSSRLSNQKNIEEIIANQVELANRGMRRNDRKYAVYESTYEELEKVDTEFPVQDTLITDKILDYMEADFYLVILLVLLVFGVFSNLIQTKITNQIVVSKLGIRRFVVRQSVVSIVITLITVILYYVGMILIFSNGNIGNVAWNLPIQAIFGYENLHVAYSVGQYILLYFVMKSVYCLTTVCVILMLSAVSKNTIISAFASALYCGCMFMAFHSLVNNGSVYGLLFIGSVRPLLVEFPYISVGTTVISYFWVYLVVLLLMAGIFFELTVYLSKFTAKRWVK